MTLYYHFITSRSDMQHVTGQILAQKGQKRSRLMGSDIVNIPLHILLKNFEQQCNGINIHAA